MIIIKFLKFNQNSNGEYKVTIQKAIENIIKSIENCSDVYALAVSAYALQLADHESKNMLLNRLMELAKSKGERSISRIILQNSSTFTTQFLSFSI